MTEFEHTCESASANCDASQTDEPTTYSVATWDHDTQGWHTRDGRATKWRLRHWLRKLYAESWDRVSILIERNS